MAGGGIVFVPWYATGFRADALSDALAEIAPVAMRYGATEYAVYRSRDDLYKFTQTATFDTKDDWERYWYGEDFTHFRAVHASWYQVPVLYVWHDLVAGGSLQPQATE
jgi:hypothetical protein